VNIILPSHRGSVMRKLSLTDMSGKILGLTSSVLRLRSRSLARWQLPSGTLLEAARLPHHPRVLLGQTSPPCHPPRAGLHLGRTLRSGTLSLGLPWHNAPKPAYYMRPLYLESNSCCWPEIAQNTFVNCCQKTRATYSAMSVQTHQEMTG
jgi:hypothetical protein